VKLVGTVDGGMAALEAVDQLHPDAVLLDIMMPDMGASRSRATWSRARRRRPSSS